MSRYRNSLFVLLLVVFLWNPAGCSSKDPQPTVGPPPRISSDELMELDPKGMQLIEKLYGQAIAQPGSAQALLQLAMVYHAHALWEPAIEAYEQALVLLDLEAQESELQAYRALAQHLMASIYVAKDDLTQGIVSMRRVAELDETYIPAQYLLALRLRDIDALDEAEDVAKLAVERAELLLQRSSNAAANTIGQGIMQSARLAYAVILLDQGQPRLAAIQAKNAVESDPAHRYARFIYGTAMRELGHEEVASRFIKLGQGAVAEWSDPWIEELAPFQVGYQVDLVRADHHVNSGNPDKAISLLMPLYNENPEDVTVLVTMGSAYLRLAQLDIAERMLRKAVALDPDSFEAQVLLTGVCRESIALTEPVDSELLLQEGLRHADRAIELRPTIALGYIAKADLLYAHEAFSEAADLYRQADGLDEQGRGIDRQAGIAFTKAQRWDEAIEILQEVAILYPRDISVLAELVEAQLGGGYREQAQQTLLQMERVNPQSPLVIQWRAVMQQVPRQ